MGPVDSADLIKARDKLLNGDVVAIPTETVYGLAASIDSEEALRKIFALKERPFFDPLIVHVSGFKEAMSVCREWPPLADFIARTFWPGPLTLVLKKAERIASIITSGLDTVALRYPAHPLAVDLIRLVGSPLAAPSANKFGRTSPSRASHVRTEFPGENLLILDGGPCEVGVESTVIEFPDSSLGEAHSASTQSYTEIRILRPGAVTAEMLREALTKYSGHCTVTHTAPSDPNNQASPGHLKHHYMPRIPLIIVDESETATLSQETKAKILNNKELDLRNRNRETFRAVELHLDDDPAQAARELYTEMRSCSESGADAIIVRVTQSRTQGLWLAIWDRLSRAASLDLTAR